jgi:hypothetical protein
MRGVDVEFFDAERVDPRRNLHCGPGAFAKGQAKGSRDAEDVDRSPNPLRRQSSLWFAERILEYANDVIARTRDDRRSCVPREWFRREKLSPKRSGALGIPKQCARFCGRLITQQRGDTFEVFAACSLDRHALRLHEPSMPTPRRHKNLESATARSLCANAHTRGQQRRTRTTSVHGRNTPARRVSGRLRTAPRRTGCTTCGTA